MQGTVLTSFISDSDPCPYLAEEHASLEYRQIASMSSATYVEYVRRGWRRHGLMFFRPRCANCRQCISLRVPVAKFRPSKSQRRCLRKNASLRCEVARPDVTAEHIELFNRYHYDMAVRKDWPNRETDANDYAAAFLMGHFEFGYEFRYYDGKELVAVGLVDLTTEASSSVYFYHAPERRADGLGVYSMLIELQFGREHGIDHHYLGYWIEACPSMAYKSGYRPYELLSEYVNDDVEPEWRSD